MSCKLAIIGLLCLVYCTGSVYAVLGAACVGTAGTVGDCDAVNNEVCNADPVCECNAATGYEVSSGDATVCALKDCSTNNPTPTGYTITSPTLVGDASTVACDTGYTGPPTTTTLNCGTDGNYDAAFAGCSLVDCASDTQPAGYINMVNTKYGESAAADCDTGSGYSGTAALAAGACKADGTWDASKFSGCTAGGQNDLKNTYNEWKLNEIDPCDRDVWRSSVRSAMRTASQLPGWEPTDVDDTPETARGGGIDLGNACSTNLECTSGNGGSGSKCDTNCVCDATSNYVENSSTCKLATDLGNACSANEECTLGNGGAGATCSTNCVCDEASGYTESGSTCTKNAGTNLLSMFNVVSMLAIILMMKLM